NIQLFAVWPMRWGLKFSRGRAKSKTAMRHARLLELRLKRSFWNGKPKGGIDGPNQLFDDHPFTRTPIRRPRTRPVAVASTSFRPSRRRAARRHAPPERKTGDPFIVGFRRLRGRIHAGAAATARRAPPGPI